MKISIVPYQPEWPKMFESEKLKIEQALKELRPRVDHIGSTSVAGLAAKPIIDILVGISSDEFLEQTIAPMIAAGYTYFKKYESGMPYRRLFAKLHSPDNEPIPERVMPEDDIVTGRDFISLANIHIITEGTVNWKRHIAFRDYLRSHENERNEYQVLKIEISKREFRDTPDYNDAKNDFVKKVEKMALDWYDSLSK